MTEPTIDTRVSLLEQNQNVINSKLDEILQYIKSCNKKEIDFINELNTIKTNHSILKARLTTISSIFTIILVPLIIAVTPILIDHHIPNEHTHQNE